MSEIFHVNTNKQNVMYYGHPNLQQNQKLFAKTYSQKCRSFLTEKSPD